MLLFAEIRRLKKGKCKLGLDKLRFQVKRCLCITWKVAANEDLELKRDVWAGDMGVSHELLDDGGCESVGELLGRRCRRAEESG